MCSKMTKNTAECLCIIFIGNSLTNAAKCAIILHVRNEHMFALRKGNTMTNAMIILNESVRLMEEGKLKGTGETVKIIKMPTAVPIHAPATGIRAVKPTSVPIIGA